MKIEIERALEMIVIEKENFKIILDKREKICYYKLTVRELL